MSIAEAFKLADSANLQLPHTALLMLSSQAVPEAARQEALQLATNGQHVGIKEAQAIIGRHREPTGTTDRPGLPDRTRPRPPRDRQRSRSRNPGKGDGRNRSRLGAWIELTGAGGSKRERPGRWHPPGPRIVTPSCKG